MWSHYRLWRGVRAVMSGLDSLRFALVLSWEPILRPWFLVIESSSSKFREAYPEWLCFEGMKLPSLQRPFEMALWGVFGYLIDCSPCLLAFRASYHPWSWISSFLKDRDSQFVRRCIKISILLDVCDVFGKFQRCSDQSCVIRSLVFVLKANSSTVRMYWPCSSVNSASDTLDMIIDRLVWLKGRNSRMVLVNLVITVQFEFAMPVSHLLWCTHWSGAVYT